MRVVVTGATGNAGTSLLHALTQDPAIEEIVGLARRRPELDLPRTRWVSADVATDDLSGHFRGADCVVHLAWLIQPSRDRATTRAVNVEGSRRVFEATAEAGVESLVYASSVGAYSPGPKDRTVDESWPTGGIQTSFYSRDKAEVERILDRFEAEHPDMRVVRLRPGLIFMSQAASGIRRLFAGPLLPSPLLRPQLIPIVPATDRLRFQAVHSLDVGEAYHRAITRDVHGPFNIAAEPVLDPPELGRLLGARPVPVSEKALRAAVQMSWKLRLQPSPPGWLDMALGVPLMDTSRARNELGWTATRSAGDALLELLEGMRRG
ncbi:MAG: NAD-dependent epimerase/dehydratase family protein, partial [Actinomycetota bacterium]|nr:NAD-dependent epimerase/dehydratase family protein [Actinomycetota bacterium]